MKQSSLLLTISLLHFNTILSKLLLHILTNLVSEHQKKKKNKEKVKERPCSIFTFPFSSLPGAIELGKVKWRGVKHSEHHKHQTK